MFKHLLNHHTPLEKQLERTSGAAVEALPVPVRALHDPAVCPAPLLPWLAWERSVDYWRDDWSEQTKRDVIAASVAVHRKKGTLAAVRQAIAATGLEAVVEVPRDKVGYVPHTFRVRVDAEITPPTSTNVAEIRYQIDHVKPARAGYDVNFHQTATVDPATLRTGAVTSIHAAQTRQPEYIRHAVPLRAVVSRPASCLIHMREAA
jgi:phage tail P2-like protein